MLTGPNSHLLTNGLCPTAFVWIQAQWGDIKQEVTKETVSCHQGPNLWVPSAGQARVNAGCRGAGGYLCSSFPVGVDPHWTYRLVPDKGSTVSKPRAAGSTFLPLFSVCLCLACMCRKGSVDGARIPPTIHRGTEGRGVRRRQRGLTDPLSNSPMGAWMRLTKAHSSSQPS